MVMRKWEEPELILALALYCTLPASKIAGKTPAVMELAAKLGRSPGSVSFKLANFLAIDEKTKGKGFSHYGNTDKLVMERFTDPATSTIDLLKLSESVQEVLSTGLYSPDVEKIILPERYTRVSEFLNPQMGEDKQVTAKVRLGQNFFRRSVLANCGDRCMITGCRYPSLLEAAHILPWSDFHSDRLSMGNGIALNVLMHRAYDRNLMGISPDGKVEFAESFIKSNEAFYHRSLEQYVRQPIDFGRVKEQINKEYLDYRYQEFRAGRYDL